MTRFGTSRDGREVQRLTIAAGDLTAHLLTYGAALQDVRLADIPHSLTVGSPDLNAYEGPLASAGTIMGPVANRIADARATIDGTEHRFDANFLGAHTLHGGAAAFHAELWQVIDQTETGAILRLHVTHGEGGFPGNRTITARFQITAPATLTLTLTATTDAPTLLNLANHSYWNVGPEQTTKGHRLTVHADRYLPTEQPSTLPTGEIADVTGTRFDYRRGRAIEAGAEGLLDNNFCLSDTRQPLRPAATLTGPTGIAMEMGTTEPGLQVFDGHILDLPHVASTDGPPLEAYAGLALEAQFWPNAPHNPHFPSILLHPGEEWRQITTWTFTKP